MEEDERAAMKKIAPEIYGKSCLKCFNLRAKIPMSGDRNIWKRKLLYGKARVWCRCGQLLMTNGKDRIYKTALNQSAHKMLVWKAAQRCAQYDDTEEYEG
jgi:hypothetical protein